LQVSLLDLSQIWLNYYPANLSLSVRFLNCRSIPCLVRFYTAECAPLDKTS